MTDQLEKIRAIALAIDGHTNLLRSKSCRTALTSYNQIDTLVCYIATKVCERMSFRIDDSISMRPVQPAEMTQHLLNGIPVSHWLPFYRSLDKSYKGGKCIHWIGPLTNKASKNAFPQIRRHRRTESRLEGTEMKTTAKPRFDRLIQATGRNDKRMSASNWNNWRLKKTCKLSSCINLHHFSVIEIKSRKRKREEEINKNLE